MLGGEVEERLDTRPGRGDLCIGVELTEDLFGPEGEAPVLVDAGVEVEPDDEKASAKISELESDAAAKAIGNAFCEGSSFGAGEPGGRVVGLCALGVSAIGHFGELVAALLIAPGDPAPLVCERGKGAHARPPLSSSSQRVKISSIVTL